MRPIHLVPASLLRVTNEVAVPADLCDCPRYLDALAGAVHLKSRLLTFSSGYDMVAAASMVKATEVCVPIEYSHLGEDVVESGFKVVPVVWDYHDPEHFLSHYERALMVADELGSATIAIAQPRVHDKRTVHGFTRYASIKAAVLGGIWSKRYSHYLFGGFNPAEPVVYRNQFSGFVHSSISAFVSGIMLRSIMFGQVFSGDFGLYDRAVDDVWEYRVAMDPESADYHLTSAQYSLWNRNMDQFMGFFKGVGGESLLDFVRWEETNAE